MTCPLGMDGAVHVTDSDEELEADTVGAAIPSGSIKEITKVITQALLRLNIRETSELR